MPAPRLVLHIGSHKTGTTAIQAALARDRRMLAARGIHYPGTFPEFPPTQTAHHKVAHAVKDASIRNRLGLAVFSRRLRWQANRFDLTLLSAEPIYRHVLAHPEPRDTEEWFTSHADYLRRLSTYLREFDVEIVLYLRKPHDFAESLYKEAASKVRSGPLPDFIDMVEAQAPLFDYPRHVALLSEIFGKVDLRSYAAEAEKGLVRGFYASLGVEAPVTSEKSIVRASLSNRGVAWLQRQGGKEGLTEQSWRIFYAARDPDGLFREASASTLWSSPHAYERFVGRYAASYAMDVIGGESRLERAPVEWTEEMQATADRQYAIWRDANLDLLNSREARGLRHWQT